MPNLYEVAQDLVFVEAKLLAEGGEFSDEEQALLDGLEIDFDELGENIIKSIRNNEAQAEMNKNEAQFFSDRARVASNKAKAYKKFIQMCMAARQLDKHEFGLFKAAIQRASAPAVEVLDLHKVPEEFTRTIVEVDKKKAVDHMKATGEIPEGLSISYSHFLRIR